MRKQSGDVKFQTEVLVGLVDVETQVIILVVRCQLPQHGQKMVKFLTVTNISKYLRLRGLFGSLIQHSESIILSQE